MSRKKREVLLPKSGDEQLVSWLPRDVKFGWTEKTPKGTLFLGWSDNTLQLWETISEGPEAKARFIGFVTKKTGGFNV